MAFPDVITQVPVGLIANAITLCNALIDRYDLKKEVRDSCARLKELLSSCRDKANDLNAHSSRYRTDVWKDNVSEISDSLTDVESRLRTLSEGDGKRGNWVALPRRKFRQPNDMDKKLTGLITDAKQIDMKIFIFQIANNQYTEANATNSPDTNEAFTAQPRVAEERSDEPTSMQLGAPVQVETSLPDKSLRNASQPETTTAFSLVSGLARGCMDLVVYSSRALITLGKDSLLRAQEALVASAVEDCSDCLRLLGSKTWYFCGSNTLPAFVVKMALRENPHAARRKIIDMLMALAPFGTPAFTLDFRATNTWDTRTAMDVSFVNALIIKEHFAHTSGPSAHGKAEILNDINPVLNISASDMCLVLQALRCGLLVDQGLVIVSKQEKGLGWYQVLFEGDSTQEPRGAFIVRLEFICSLDLPRDSISNSHDIRDPMILNFLHTAEIPPEARCLRLAGRRHTYLETVLRQEGNMFEGDKAMFEKINIDGVPYIELLEIACVYTFRARNHVLCQSYVDSLVENVDERQLVVSNAGREKSLYLRRGVEISFDVLAQEFYESVINDAQERGPSRLASWEDLVAYGRFCTQEEVRDSWHDLLVETVANRIDVNFAQAALTGRKSYTNFVARNKSVRLKDSILVCDPASDSIAVAFDEASELSSSLRAGVSELLTTTASERLRAAFFISKGAVRANRHVSTKMVDVMRSRYMGLQGIGSISARDVTEDLDEGEFRNHAVLLECMECLAMQGGYGEGNLGSTLFNLLCSYRECEKTILVTGIWPPLFGRFRVLQGDTSTMVQLDALSQFAILASRHGDIYRTQQICRVRGSYDPKQFTISDEFVSVK